MATVPASNRSTTYNIVADGAGPYLVGFRLFDTDALDVYVAGLRRTDFTIQATFANGFDDAATITFNSSITAPAEIIIEGAMVPDREADYVSGPANLAQALNVELPRIWAVLQELRRSVRRAVRGFTEVDPAAGIDLAAISAAEGYAVAAASSAATASAAAAQAVAAENTKIVWRGPWVTATAYAPSDLVRDSNNDTYVCVIAHTSGTFATDLAASRWQLFVPKGSAGAGTGDLLAANNLSELAASAGTVRGNLALMGALLTAENSQDVHTRAAANPRGMWFVAGTSMTNAPSGYSTNDAFFSKGLDANNVTVVWFRQDGVVFVKTRVAGTWGGWVQQGTQAAITAAVDSILHVRDVKVSGIDGGTATSGSYFARTLNVVVTNSISGASLASNQVTLPAGTYLVEGSVPGVAVGAHKAKLYNVTDGADLIIGTAAKSPGSIDTYSVSHVRGRIVLAGTKVLELRHRVTTTRATYGCGQASGFGDSEVYAELRITKIA